MNRLNHGPCKGRPCAILFAMKKGWRRIKSQWNFSDTLVLTTNLSAFALFMGNCWWESVNIVYVATLFPLSVQALRSIRTGGVLREALTFGAIVAWLWPPIEGAITLSVGWWGSYTAQGMTLFDTPVHAVLIAWLAASYCMYLSRRVVEMEFSRRVAVIMITGSALALGIIGENLFVAAGMWTYRSSVWNFGSVPAIIPLAYTVAYSAVPFLRQFHVVYQALAVLALLVMSSVTLGFATGFFPEQ